MSMSPKDMDFLEAKHTAAREIALALGVPPMLLAIPGDNTFSNYQEANRTFWRQTVLPLVARTCEALSSWLSPGYNEPLTLRPDTDSIDALSSEREALWTRLEKASFLTNDEKRAAIGYGPLPTNQTTATKFNPLHAHDGRFDFSPDGAQPVAFRPKPPTPPPPAKPAQPPPSTTPKPGTTSQSLSDILLPGGQEIGDRLGGAGDGIRTVSPQEVESLKSRLLSGATEVPSPPGYQGRTYQRSDGTVFGIRESGKYGSTVDVMKSNDPRLKPGYQVHRK
jgi:hypothetical protein